MHITQTTRAIIYSIIMLGGMSVVSLAYAQQSVPETKNETAKSKTQSKAGAKDDKTAKSKRPKTEEDLDGFFKEGERQSESGGSCQPPPEPIV